MPEPHGRRASFRSGSVFLLAFAAGWVDAVGFRVLFQLFIAHMSGNSIAMNVYLGEGNWREAFHRAFPIPVFLAGVALGMVLNELLWRRKARSIFATSLLLEALCLSIFAVLGGTMLKHGSISMDPWWKFYALAALPVLAMGVQNATLKRIAGRPVRTTYISGVLTDSVEESVKYVFQRWDRFVSRKLPEQDFGALAPSLAGILLLASIWLAYASGGLLGTVTEMHWRLHCLAAPICCLLCVAALDLAYPLASPSSDA